MMNREELVEYVTFGRRPQLLFRVWILQLVVIFFEAQVFRVVHPAVTRLFDRPVVLEIYLAVVGVALVVLAAFVRRMARLTFSARFRDLRHVGLSVVGYLLLGGTVVALVVPAPNVPPVLADGLSVPELALAAMATVTLAALLAVGFYALFDLEDYPSRREIRRGVGEWLDALDWAAEPEGSRAKRERYGEFLARTEELSGLLDYAVTAEGERLRTDFEAWVEAYSNQSPLSQEAIVTGDVEDSRLAAQEEALNRLVERLERIAE